MEKKKHRLILVDDEKLILSSETGMNGYITKPIDPLALANELEKWIGKETSGTEQAGGQAHKIKGAAGNVTALTFQETAFEMERVGKAGDRETLQRLLPKLEKRFQQLKAQMEKEN